MISEPPQQWMRLSLPPSDVWLDKAEHVERRLVQLDEHSVVDLTKTQQLKDLADLRVHSIDTEQQDKGDSSKKQRKLTTSLYRKQNHHSKKNNNNNNNFATQSPYPLIRITKASLGWSGT